MLIAVGLYLPFETSSAIFLGGLMKWLADRAVSNASDERKKLAEDQGTFIASGLIAGEATVGILLAALFLAGMPSITKMLTGHDEFVWLPKAGAWLSLSAFLSTAYMLIRIPTRR